MNESLSLKRKKPVDDVVNEVNRLIEWFLDGYKNATLDQLADARSKLTTHLFTLATYIGEAKEEELASDTRRKIKHHAKRKEFIEANYSIARAEDEAILSTQKEMEEADKWASYYVTLRLMLDQANKVDDAILQKISIMKQEKASQNA